MARVGRIAGALLAETGGEYFLVGNTKRPCEWPKAGFEAPAAIDALARPFQRLTAVGPVSLGETTLALELEGEALAQRLADFLVIQRTGSVSERLWRLVTGAAFPDEDPAAGAVDARWLGEVPPAVWRVVQDTVLRCV